MRPSASCCATTHACVRKAGALDFPSYRLQLHSLIFRKEKLRRDEREITSRREIDRIIRRATVCRLAFVSEGEPYLVPVCFGYDGGSLYFHCAPEGRKLGMLSPGVRVCFELEADLGVIKAESACGWTMAYSSVIGWGTASLVQDPQRRKEALDTIMHQYGGPEGPYGEKVLGRTTVVRIDIEKISAKSNLPHAPVKGMRTEP